MSKKQFKSYVSASSIEDVTDLGNKHLDGNISDITRVDVGEINAVYFVKTENRQEVVVRISPKERDYNNFELEAWAFNLCRKKGVPTPKVIAVDGSMKDFPEAYMISERLPGKSGGKTNLATPHKEKLVKQLGHYLYLIHSIKLEGFGILKKYKNTFVGRCNSFQEYLEYELEFGWWVDGCLKNKLISQKDLGILRKFFKENKNIFKLDKASLVHGDISPSFSNVNIQNNKVTGIFDMENARAHDPVFDFAWFNFWELPGDKNLNLLKAGYGNKKLFNDKFGTKLCFFQLMIGYSLLSYYNNRKRKKAFDMTMEKVELLKRKLV